MGWDVVICIYLSRNDCDWTNNQISNITGRHVPARVLARNFPDATTEGKLLKLTLCWYSWRAAQIVKIWFYLHKHQMTVHFRHSLFFFVRPSSSSSLLNAYLRGSVSAATENSCDYLLTILSRGGGAKFIYEWVIFVQPFSPFQMSLCRGVIRYIHSYKYPMMCRSVIASHGCMFNQGLSWFNRTCHRILLSNIPNQLRNVYSILFFFFLTFLNSTDVAIRYIQDRRIWFKFRVKSLKCFISKSFGFIHSQFQKKY